MTDETKRDLALEQALAATRDAGEQAQADAAMQYMQMNPPSAAANDTLWRALVYGLVAVAILCVVGAVLLLFSDKSIEPLQTMFAAAVTGVIGLFVSPGGDG